MVKNILVIKAVKIFNGIKIRILRGDKMEKNWHEIFNEFLASLTAITNGKQQYFEQEDGKWYSRISGEYLTTDEMIAEYLDDIKSFVE